MTPPYRAKEDVIAVRREDWEALVRAATVALEVLEEQEVVPSDAVYQLERMILRVKHYA